MSIVETVVLIILAIVLVVTAFIWPPQDINL